MKKKANVIEFRTIGELHCLPLEKIEMFTKDLALWLQIHKVAEMNDSLKATTPRDVFAWIDDGKHNVRINVSLKG